MLFLTHLTRVNVAGDDAKEKVWKNILTPNVAFPVTIDDVRTLLDDPNFTREVEVVFNEQGGAELKRTVKMPFIAKLVVDSIKLLTNAKAKATLGIDPLQVAAEVIAENPASEDAKAAVKAMGTKPDNKAALREWAEAYVARKSQPAVNGDGNDGLEGDGK